MCELLGISFNQPVRAALSFRGFRLRGEQNPHGWGVARFEGKACQVFKEPVMAKESRLATFLRDYEGFSSKIFLGHVRYASSGSPGLQNTHPFVRTFRSRDVVLAHNGTLSHSLIEQRRLKFHPVGETDSELLLCALLTRLSDERIAFADFARVEATLREYNGFGSMNLLFSEGAHLYVYRDRDSYNGLGLVERRAPFGRVSLRDEDWEVDLQDEKRPGQVGVLIATRPLTDERWESLEAGSLRVFEDGACVYRGARQR